MGDLVGRFFSFEEHLGRGLVRFTYFLALFYLVVLSIFAMVVALIKLNFGAFLLVPFRFILFVVLLRVGAELVLAILSIEERSRVPGGSDGFEAGLTPSDRPRPEDLAAAQRASSAPSQDADIEMDPSVADDVDPPQTDTDNGDEAPEGNIDDDAPEKPSKSAKKKKENGESTSDDASGD